MEIVENLATPFTHIDFEDFHTHYFYDPKQASDFQIEIDYDVYKQVMATLPDFDFSAGVADLKNLHIIRGSHDFTSDAHIYPLQNIACSYHEIAESAHFPFFESPKAFFEILDGLIS